MSLCTQQKLNHALQVKVAVIVKIDGKQSPLFLLVYV
ncbi:TPA: hypothetical protein O9731_000969 [Staphylococcus aureus]|nr:hypothetical protein [Staphylococcus aureus]HDD0490773.1 hypothetical protein [Staphylococcus aureus]HDD0720707.1 hypothetical protein [Staphylococcus aureus]HDF6682275.1 hypothetical protein [Staphylococcus aureus]HDF6748489.1 hypothetical protein [Staphylococcus aureus]HDK3376618.1 hypothetical protein [Staphylococcus aureus]